MDEAEKSTPSAENLRAAMDAAWRDHHHARDQTWRSLTIEAYLAAGLITVDAQFGRPWITFAAGALIAVAAALGAMITLNHRKLERRKFIHLMNCEEMLKLHRDDLIPLTSDGMSQFHIQVDEYNLRKGRDVDPELVTASAVSVPRPFSLFDAFNLNVQNTAVFILRMHIAIILFAMILVIARFVVGPKSP
jgi:hypothetical protein